MFAYRLHVDEVLARRCAREIFIRSGGRRNLLVGLLGVLSFAGATFWTYRLYGPGWMPMAYGVLTGVCTLGCLMQFVTRQALTRQLRNEPFTDIEMGEDGLTRATPLAKVTWPWRSFSTVEDLCDVLLLELGKNRYIVLPTIGMPDGAREFVILHMDRRWEPPNNALDQARGR